MKNSSHSDPSLPPKGSKVAADASSVASVSHVKGITKKPKKSDLVLGGDGEDVGSWSQPASPSSGEASSPLSGSGTPKQKKNDNSQPDHPASQGAGDVCINHHARVVDNCLDASSRMDKSIPPAGLGSSRSQETTLWMQENKVNIPIPVTEEKVAADHKQKQGAEEEEIEELLEKVGSLKAKLNTPLNVLKFWSTCDERQQAEIYQRLSQYYNKALELSGEEPDYAELNEESEVPLRVYEYFFLDRVEDYNREWYFHPELCKLAGLDDYQRLVIRDDCTYGDLNEYHRTFHTLVENRTLVPVPKDL